MTTTSGGSLKFPFYCPWRIDLRIVLSLISPFLLLGLTACTTTVTPMDGISTEVPTVEQSPDFSDKGSALAKMSADDLVTSGNSYLARGNLNVARLHFLMAVKKDEKPVRAFMGLGKIMFRQGRFEDAAELYGKALELEPNHVPVLLAIAKTARKQGDSEASLDHLELALHQEPDNPEILTELGFTYDVRGQANLAETYYNRVIELRPGLASAHNNLGFSYLLQERYDDAIAAFNRALTLAPSNQKALNNLGTAYGLNGNSDKALQIFEKTLGPAAAYNNLGYLYMTEGRWKEAEKALGRALDLNPTFYVKAQKNLDRLQRLRAAASE